jgi:prepilin-type N-terminal cleavage/methylation domain-containing protein
MNITKKSYAQSIACRRPAFTLIELLVVIAVIATLAAFTIPVISGIKKRQFISSTQAQMNLIVTALESYKADHGYYPPCNTNNAITNQLYYELVGTATNVVAGNTTYEPLDGSSGITQGNVPNYFGIGGFMNCSQGSGEDAKKARSYLLDLKPGQIATDATGVRVLVASVNGPDAQYQPMPGFTSGNNNPANPFRYVYPGTNNPSSYDLWVQLSIGSSFAGVNNFSNPKKYLICNWSKQVLVNNSLP